MRSSKGLSVIMSVCNGGSFLEEAVQSILNQKFQDYEFLIVDDASTDSTPELLEKMASQDDRIRVLKNQTNLGLTKSLNLAIRQATSNWIARQDADDISSPDRLHLQMECLKRDSALGLLGSFYEGIDEKGRLLYRMMLPTGSHEIGRWLQTVNCFCHGSVIFSKKVFMQVRGYPEQYPFAQDYALWLRLASLTKMGNLPSVLYRKRIHKRSVSQKNPDRWEVAQQLKLDAGLIQKQVGRNRFMAREHWHHGQFLIGMGRYQTGINSLLKGSLLFLSGSGGRDP